jgi:hypothetical protein
MRAAISLLRVYEPLLAGIGHLFFARGRMKSI